QPGECDAGERAQHRGDGGADGGDLKAENSRLDDLGIVEQRCVPFERKPGPHGHQPAFVERKDHQRDDGQVKERKAEHGEDGNEGAASHVSFSTTASCARLSSTIGTSRMASMTMATADATGQSRLAKNSSHSTRPIISVSAPPKSEGMTNSPMAGIKTSMEPAMTPGIESGRMTVRRVVKGRAPRSAEASIRLWSSLTSVV